MATKPRNTVAKTVPAYVAQFSALLWGFVESAAANASRSSEAMAIVAAMYAALTPAQFNAAIVEQFGNGEKGKAHDKGALITALEAKVTATNVDRPESLKLTVPVSARSFTHQVRTVAENFGNAAVRDAAAKSGTRAAYDARPGGKNDPAKVADVEVSSKPATVTEVGMIGDVIRTEGLAGAIRLMGLIESGLSAVKDPIRAGIVHDAKARMAA